GMMNVLTDIDMPLVAILAKMEQHGVYIDTDFLIDYSSDLDQAMKSLEKKVFEAAGEEVNLNSPTQLQKVLFDTLKIPDQLGVKRLKRTKTGYSTDESVLNMLSAHPIPKMILDYRQVAKLKNTYVDTLPQHVHAKTKRLHTTLHQT